MNTRRSITRILLLLLLIPTSAFAHEMWVLTNDVVRNWSEKPLPSTYTSFTLPTVLVVVIALGINAVLFQLHRRGAAEMFPVFRARMRSMRPYAAVVLRVCLSWVLLSSAMAMEPRFGNEVWSNPTLLAPDILISELPLAWQWLRWMEFSIGIALIAGIYVRAAAAACLALVFLALFLTGMAAVSYAPVYTGAALYLFFAGAGIYFIPLPAPRKIKLLTESLVKNASISRAQFILRVLAGSNFLFLAIYFKVMQPNLMLAIIDVHELPILGLRPEVFVLIIAAVEVSIGVLVIFGILLRFLSVVLIAAFVFFAICLSDAETLTSHMLYYGVAISFLFNGSGQWRKKVAGDIRTKIIILGNSLPAVAAAQELEKLLPRPSNVEVSLLTSRLDVQFTAMLPEVVSGAVQATTLINPLSKVLERTNVVLGDVRSVDTKNKTLSYAIPGGTEQTASYDELIIAMPPAVDKSIESATVSQKIYHLNTIVDALELKQQLLNCLITHGIGGGDAMPPALKVAIFGGGERGSALAMEVHSLVEILISERCIPRTLKVNVILIESVEEQMNMTKKILHMRSKHFRKHSIKVVDASRIATLCHDSVRLLNGKAVKMDVVVNLGTKDVMPQFSDIDAISEKLCQPDLAFHASSNIWMAVNTGTLRTNSQRRLSMQLEQAQLAGFNAWASSQALPTNKIRPAQKSLYECYMGRHTVATWRGIALPSAVGWMLNRRRYISTLPSLERKLRILIDWGLDFVFNHDTAGLLDYDYQLNQEKVLQSVPNRDKPVLTAIAENESAVRDTNKKAA
ncbi:FAD-dependent oxidoreductase [Granulosicoccus sp.]|nr:FAD-dependent oxidoreductase [Granulosicoccus sp.]MDB4223512.1 FAD-dependent oxidoreductase [Granulosicoccus sp.]